VNHALNLPPAELPIRDTDGKRFIFDVFRKRYVALTPEEWVRQHFLHWLVNHKGYPGGLIAVEAALTYFRLKKRADAIVYDKTGKPLMIIECKSPAVPVTQDVFDQVARYNLPFGVSFLAVTNGISHFCCRFDKTGNTWHFLDIFPEFAQIT